MNNNTENITEKNLLIEEERKNILNAKSNFYVREAYNALRTNLGFALAEAPEQRVIVVTSAMQSEGKSITAVNLSLSLAEAGNKVILIDGDLRKPKLSRLLRLKSSVGLSDLLVDTNKASHSILKYKDIIDVMLAGSIPPNPSELLGSNVMDATLSSLRKIYDYVIIDTPPINMVTDAVVIAPATDGVLFVVKSGESDRNAVAFAVDQLKYANAKILGFIMNGIALEGTSYGYNKYKYRKYGYRKYYKKYGGKYGYGKYGYDQNGYGYGAGYVQDFEIDMGGAPENSND